VFCPEFADLRPSLFGLSLIGQTDDVVDDRLGVFVVVGDLRRRTSGGRRCGRQRRGHGGARRGRRGCGCNASARLERLDLGFEIPDLQLESLDLLSELVDLRVGRAGLGWNDRAACETKNRQELNESRHFATSCGAFHRQKKPPKRHRTYAASECEEGTTL